MKRFFTLSFLFFSFVLLGQNLIPDPSVEDFFECPSSLGFPELWLNNWETYRGSPDYFNTCSEALGASNSVGFQDPRSGQGYLGGVSHSTASMTREFFGIALTEPLSIGTTYYISFYASLAHKVSAGIRTASNNIGALFTVDNYIESTENGSVPNWNHLNFEAILSDTLSWTLINGMFTADSAYTRVLFGNFFDDDNTLFEYPFAQDNAGQAYYYYDDFCVTLDPNGCDNFVSSSNLINENQILIWPNPTLSDLNYSGNLNFSEIRIVNLQGTLVYSEKAMIQNYGKVELNLQPGAYIIEFLSKKESIKKRFVVQ